MSQILSCKNSVDNTLIYTYNFGFRKISVLNSEDMLVAFCVGHFIAGCVSAYRIFAICDGCHHLIAEMRETKKSLNELTILKHKVIKSGFIYISTFIIAYIIVNIVFVKFNFVYARFYRLRNYLSCRC